MRKLVLLLVGTALFWLTATGVAHLIWGETVWLPSSVACVLCLIPAAGTLVWIASADAMAVEKQLMLVFGSTGIRLLVVLGCGMAIFLGFPDYFPLTFWVWLGVFYIVTLGLEVTLLTRQPTQEQ